MEIVYIQKLDIYGDMVEIINYIYIYNYIYGCMSNNKTRNHTLW